MGSRYARHTTVPRHGSCCLALARAWHVVAMQRKDRIKPKDFPGPIGIGGCHDETVNKGRPFVRGRRNGIQECKCGSSTRRGTAGKEHSTGGISRKQRPPDKHRVMSADVVADAVERLGKDLGGKHDAALCVGDHVGDRLGLLVPAILHIDLGNQG